MSGMEGIPELEKRLAELEEKLKEAVHGVAERKREFVAAMNDMAASMGLAGVGDVRAAQSFGQRNILQPSQIRGPANAQNLTAAIGANDAPEMQRVAEQARRWEDADAHYAALNEQAKQARLDFAAVRSSGPGLYHRYASDIPQRRMREGIQRQAQMDYDDTPEGQAATQQAESYRSLQEQKGQLIRGQMRGDARKQAAKELGIKLPDDMNLFSKTLQQTFKSAASLGMMEALSGGSAAPMARLLGASILSGVLLPMLGNSLAGFSNYFKGPSTAASFTKFLPPGTSNAIPDQVAVDEGTGAVDLPNTSDAGDDGQLTTGATGGSGGGGTGGSGASSAAATNALQAGVPQTTADAAGGNAAAATEGGVKGILDSVGGLVDSLKGAPGPVGDAASILELLKGIGGVGLSVAGAGAGLALYSTAKRTQMSVMQQQLTSAVGGPGQTGDAYGYTSTTPYGYAQGAFEIAKQFSVTPNVVEGVQGVLGNEGVQNGQSLHSNTQNAIMLSGITGADPNKMASLVGTLSTQGGMSADDITKMIALMETQNSLTKDQMVPLSTLVDNMQTLVSATGGVATSAGTAASLAAIGHTLATAGGSAGRSINTGALMAGVMGASGIGEISQAALLGMTPDDLQSYRDPKNKTGTAKLFDRMTSWVDSHAAGMGGSPEQQTAMREYFWNLASGGASGQMSLAQQQALAKLKPGDTTSPMAKKLLASVANITPGQTKDDTAAAMLNMTTALQRTIITAETDLSKLTGAGNTTLTTIQSLMETLVKSGNRSTVPGGIGPPIPPGYQPPPVPGTPGSLKSATVKGQQVPSAYLAAYQAAAKKTGIPLNILLAQGAAESSFNPQAISGAGAQGIAQFMPLTWQGLQNDPNSPIYHSKQTPFDPTSAIAAQAYLDQQNLKANKNNMTAALEVYNEGQANYDAGYGAKNGALSYATGIQQTAAGEVVTIIIEDKTTNGVSAKKKAKGS